jgi:hypothetical protein
MRSAVFVKADGRLVLKAALAIIASMATSAPASAASPHSIHRRHRDSFEADSTPHHRPRR